MKMLRRLMPRRPHRRLRGGVTCVAELDVDDREDRAARESVTVNTSFSSLATSPATPMTIVCLLSPGAKVSVPVAGGRLAPAGSVTGNFNDAVPESPSATEPWAIVSHGLGVVPTWNLVLVRADERSARIVSRIVTTRPSANEGQPGDASRSDSLWAITAPATPERRRTRVARHNSDRDNRNGRQPTNHVRANPDSWLRKPPSAATGHASEKRTVTSVH
jgi:hypothetical protein